MRRRMPKFCANLSFMFGEKPFLERYQAAKDAGFIAVETGFPFGHSRENVESAKNASGIQQVLINVFTGDVTKGEVGYAAIPGKEEEFKKSIATSLEYAKAVGAKKLHIMAGKVAHPTESNDATYESNLHYATKLLEQNDIVGLIEPINKYSVPNYFLNNYEQALSVINKINSPNLRLMLDVFHLQQIKGDIVHSLENYLPYTGHIQIAQVPSRHEPNSPGELSYKFIIETLEKCGYNDWIGLEYLPAEETVKGLKWIEEFGYKLNP